METIMSKFHSHTVCSLFTAGFFLALHNLVGAQVAAQQHQASLTEHYDPLLTRELPPPSESAADSAVNLSLYRLRQVLQATLRSIAGHDPSEISERANTTAEASEPYQPPGTRPPSEPREERASDAALLPQQSGLADSSQPDTTPSQVESETQTHLSPSEPSLSHDSPSAPAISTVTAVVTTTTATVDAATTIANTPVNPMEESPDPSPTAHSEMATAEHDSDLDWSEVRENEIARLEAENAHFRALLGIDPKGLDAAGIPDIDTEPLLMTSSFLGAYHPLAAGSSAWANAGAETASPFTLGFREDPSVLGLAATPSRLHTLTPPNAPNAMMTATSSTDANPSSTGGALTGLGGGLFVSASWAVPPAGGNGPGGVVGVGGQGQGQGGQGTGLGPGPGPGPGPMGAPQMQQKSSPPPLGFTGLGRTLDLQGPGVGLGSGPGGSGRGRGVLFGGRGRSVGW
jgi:hypothetical protein